MLPDRILDLLELEDVTSHATLSHIEPLLRDPDPSVRAAAAALVARYPLSAPTLRDARATEHDARVCTVFDLALLLHGDEGIDAATVAEALSQTWDADEVQAAFAELELGRRGRVHAMLTDLVSATPD